MKSNCKGCFGAGNGDCDQCEELKAERRKRKKENTQMQSEEKDVRVCPVCRKEVEREDMIFTRDCHGIAFRLVCFDCYKKLMQKGYDGEYYNESDEQIEDDY